MNKENLKDFFGAHRDEFDNRVPSERVWKRIQRVLFGSPSVSLWNSVVVWRVAALLMLGLSVYLMAVPRLSETRTPDLAAQQEFRDVESYYSAQIIQKVSLIRKDAGFENDSFSQDLEKLDAMYSVLMEEMKKHPSQKVKDALVLNMLVRIDLLNQEIQRLEETKKKADSEV